MKKYLLVFIGALLLFPLISNGQSNAYWMTSLEIPFQFASIEDGEDNTKNIMRFAPVINLQSVFNVDPSKAFGITIGVGVRNVGFIYDVSQEALRKKYRTYTLGIPLGIKIGDMTRTFFYAGYELEFPFSYKEKTFVNEIKDDVFTVWFSERVPTIYNSVFVGIHLNKALDLKFKYYFTNFHNQDYTEIINNVESKPYENLKANVFFIALNISLFKNVKFYYDENDFQR